MGNTLGKQILAGVTGFGKAMLGVVSAMGTGASIGMMAGPEGAVVGALGGALFGAVKGAISTANAINAVEDEEAHKQAVAQGMPSDGGDGYKSGFTPEKFAKASSAMTSGVFNLVESGVLGGDDPQARDFVKLLRSGYTMRGAFNGAGMTMHGREMSRTESRQLDKYIAQKNGGMTGSQMALMGDPLLRSQLLASRSSTSAKHAYDNLIMGASASHLAREIMGTARQPDQIQNPAPADAGRTSSSATGQSDAIAQARGQRISSGAPSAFVAQTY
jgi:hypothetical protein